MDQRTCRRGGYEGRGQKEDRGGRASGEGETAPKETEGGRTEGGRSKNKGGKTTLLGLLLLVLGLLGLLGLLLVPLLLGLLRL